MNMHFPAPWRRLTRWSLVLALGLSSLAAVAMDDPPGRVGRVADAQGKAWMMDGGQGEWREQLLNHPVTTGDRFSTERGARIELQVGSTRVQLGGGSELLVQRLDDDRIELLLVDGSLGLRVREPEVAREVEVRAGEHRFMARGPGIFRIDADGRRSWAEALQGELGFESPDSALSLRPGQRAEFWRDSADGRTHYSWAAPANDDFQPWLTRSEWREDRRPEQRHISREMTGADDLDHYGRWSSHPEYGQVWRPVAVAPDWAPYRYGRWAWVSPWGWTWVDDAPWGFAPFHYGRWVFWSGAWAWVPGRYVPRPVYAPAMVAWVGSPGVSVSVSMGSPVGWVPLAPREPYYPAYRYTPRYLEHVNSPYGRVPPAQPPREPVMYTNRGVPGGVTMVGAQALQQRAVVPVAQQRLDDEQVHRVLGGARPQVPAIVPPAPQGQQLQPRVVPVPGAAVPARPVARTQQSFRGDDDAPAPRSPAAPVGVAPTAPAGVSRVPESARAPEPSRAVEAPVRRLPQVERDERLERPNPVPVPAPRALPAERPERVERPQAVPQAPPSSRALPERVQAAPSERPAPAAARRERDDERKVPQGWKRNGSE